MSKAVSLGHHVFVICVYKSLRVLNRPLLKAIPIELIKMLNLTRCLPRTFTPKFFDIGINSTGSQR